MTNDLYQQVVRRAGKADHFWGPQLRALARSRTGLRVASVMRRVTLPVPHPGERAAVAGNRAVGVISAAGSEIARRSLRRIVGSKAQAVAGAGVPVVRSSGPAPSAKAAVARAALFAGPRLAMFGFTKDPQRGFSQRVGDESSLGAQAGRLAVQIRTGPASAKLRPASLQHGPFQAPSLASRTGRHSAMPASRQADVPGFHRTVKQARAALPAGDVYLDKALVGYHLAAAITAEQTRAAARPNISGSAFNSSMAALRPSGAGS